MYINLHFIIIVVGFFFLPFRTLPNALGQLTALLCDSVNLMHCLVKMIMYTSLPH